MYNPPTPPPFHQGTEADLSPEAFTSGAGAGAGGGELDTEWDRAAGFGSSGQLGGLFSGSASRGRALLPTALVPVKGGAGAAANGGAEQGRRAEGGFGEGERAGPWLSSPSSPAPTGYSEWDDYHGDMPRPDPKDTANFMVWSSPRSPSPELPPRKPPHVAGAGAASKFRGGSAGTERAAPRDLGAGRTRSPEPSRPSTSRPEQPDQPLKEEYIELSGVDGFAELFAGEPWDVRTAEANLTPFAHPLWAKVVQALERDEQVPFLYRVKSSITTWDASQTNHLITLAREYVQQMYEGWTGSSSRSIRRAVLPILNQGSGQLQLGQAPEPDPVKNSPYSMRYFLQGLSENRFSVVLESGCSIANLLNLSSVANSLTQRDGVFVTVRSSNPSADCHSIVRGSDLASSIDHFISQIGAVCYEEASDVLEHGYREVQIGTVIRREREKSACNAAVLLVISVLHCYLWRVSQSFYLKLLWSELGVARWFFGELGEEHIKLGDVGHSSGGQLSPAGFGVQDSRAPSPPADSLSTTMYSFLRNATPMSNFFSLAARGRAWAGLTLGEKLERGGGSSPTLTGCSTCGGIPARSRRLPLVARDLPACDSCRNALLGSPRSHNSATSPMHAHAQEVLRQLRGESSVSFVLAKLFILEYAPPRPLVMGHSRTTSLDDEHVRHPTEFMRDARALDLMVTRDLEVDRSLQMEAEVQGEEDDGLQDWAEAELLERDDEAGEVLAQGSAFTSASASSVAIPSVLLQNAGGDMPFNKGCVFCPAVVSNNKIPLLDAAGMNCCDGCRRGLLGMARSRGAGVTVSDEAKAAQLALAKKADKEGISFAEAKSFLVVHAPARAWRTTTVVRAMNTVGGGAGAGSDQTRQKRRRAPVEQPEVAAVAAITAAQQAQEEQARLQRAGGGEPRRQGCTVCGARVSGLRLTLPMVTPAQSCCKACHAGLSGRSRAEGTKARPLSVSALSELSALRAKARTSSVSFLEAKLFLMKFAPVRAWGLGNTSTASNLSGTTGTKRMKVDTSNVIGQGSVAEEDKGGQDGSASSNVTGGGEE